jgi:hypothetical protein
MLVTVPVPPPPTAMVVVRVVPAAGGADTEVRRFEPLYVKR